MVAEEESLMNGDDTGKKNDYKSDSFCVKHWKVVFAGTGVILLITLGAVIGAAFNHGSSAVTRVGRNEYKDIRLPGNVIPEKYKLYLHPNITDNKFGFDGRVRILVKCTKPTNSIILHLKNLNVIKVTVVEGDSAFEGTGSKILVSIDKSNKKKLLQFDKKNEFLVINLNGESLEEGKKYVILITYDGSLSGGLEGFYKSSYKTKSGETRYLATTHFEATMARAAFPCFDEPAMKATFQIIIAKEPQHHALSNMPIFQNKTRLDGLVDVYFNESVKMSTYLVAFVVCDYEFKYAKTSRGTEVRVWAPPEQIEQAQFAIETAPKVLEYYEKFFKVDFPLPKQDLIAIPDFAAGAMENWGLITYRLTSILYDEKESSSANKQWVAVVIAHELAHQWFGNLVTMKWWNDLWLNEGFAAFVEFIGSNHTNPEWQMMDQFIIDDVQPSLVLDSHVNSHPISVPVHDPAQINEIFDTISYDKGASIVRMMKNFLGSDVFHSGLADYLKKYQFGNAVSDDLWTALTEAAQTKGKKLNKSVKEVMDTWTLQMGYPVITIKKDGDNAAIATQKHFIVDDFKQSDITPSKYNYKWHVPLTYYTENNQNSKLTWLFKDKDNVRIKWNSTAGWLKMNTHQVGFYRVNYDSENWEALSQQLIDDHTVIPAADRSNLIDDAFELAKANLMDQTKALDMTAYLKSETEYVPWISALSSLGYIGAMLEGNPEYPNAYDYYEKYIVDQVKDLSAKLGWMDNGTHLTKYLRGAMLRSSVQHGDKKTIEEGKKVFKDWKENKTPIAPNLRSTVYLAAIKYGGHEDWDYLFNIYKTTQFPSEQRKIMFALTDTRNKTILKKYLKMSMNKDIVRSQDTCSVIEHVAMNPIAREMAYDFVKKNWDELYKRYGKGSFDMSRLLKNTFGRFTTQERYEEVKKFLSTHKVGSGKLAAKQAVATVKNHIAWLKKNGKVVNDWLESKVKVATEKRAIFM